MHAFSGRSRRQSDVVPLFNVAPTPPSTPLDASSNDATDSSSTNGLGFAARRLSRIKPMSWSQRNVIPEGATPAPSQPMPPPREEGDDDDGHESRTAQATRPVDATSTATALPRLPSGKSAKKLSLFAQSVISMNRQQQQHNAKNSDSRRDERQHSDDNDDRGKAPAGAVAASSNQSEAHDPWGHVLDKVMRKTTPTSKRVSLSQMMQRREVKDLVTQAVIANHWTESAGGLSSGLRPHSSTGGGNGSPTARSSVMEHWMKTSVLRNANPLQRINVNGDDGEFDDDDMDQDARDGIKSGFDVRATGFGAMYGRTLLLEESCRRAFAQSGENRSQMDLQALKAWFQMTKLKITTDFERLQPAELDLLCRRMALVHLHANEIVFRQGDEGDAMYIVFAGCVEVKVAQRILGEKVEVTVCELSKGDYFGERALLHDDPRAATIVAKTACELVKITRKDYTIMLKQDQQEFYSRMQLAGSVATGGIGSIVGGSSGVPNPPLILHRSRSMLHQQTQLEYVNVLTKKKHMRTKTDIDMLSEYLQTLKFFRGLPRTFVRELCTVIDFLTLPASAYVFREGEVGDLFYIIFSGSVDVIVNSKDFRGNEQQTKLINLTEGAHFGELALMKGHGIRSATVLTREETRFLVICEKDYNSTLRRMQKDDLAKRVGVLDRIPMFQTPEWTGDLLKEMSYVLSEQKLATGSVLFRQGEKAQQVYFVVRGELLVTKEIVDPATNQINVVFVERVGRDRVIGDDAAAGANFNEVIYREVTVTASTPVELLVLSKYDVFHRLSRSARETLRAAAQSHVESVVYLDRYHKTVKWDAYKRKLLKENVNHERMRKLLPVVEAASAAPKRVKKPKTPRSAKTAEPTATSLITGRISDREPSPTLSIASPSASDPATIAAKTDRELVAEEVRTILATQSQLVDANEFLLLQPVDAAIADSFPLNKRTIAHHVSTFNADAPPRTQTRDQQLRRALTTERRRRIEVLNEGNPLAYFDLDVVQAQQRQQQAEVRGRAASSRRLLMRKRPSGGTGGAAGAVAPASTVKSPSAEATATNVMNQFFQDNFIFSHPEKPAKRKSEQTRRLRLLQELEQRHGLCSSDDDQADSSGRSERTDGAAQSLGAGAKPLIRVDEARRLAELLCQGDWVVIDMMSPVDIDVSIGSSRDSPRFRILRCAESLEAAKATMLNCTQRGDDDCSDDEGNGAPPALFAVVKKRFALLPRATRPRVTEEALQRAVASKFRRPSVSTATSVAAPTALTTTTSFASDVMAGVFASFQKLALTAAEQRDHATAIATAKRSKINDVSSGGPSSKLFAIASIVLSKRELETAFCEEPFLCIHALLPTEAEAMDQALHMPPQALKNALLCVLPAGEWIHFEDAYDFCVQIEPDRRDKHPTTVATGTGSSSSPSPMRRRTGSIASGIGLAGSPSPSATKADWQIQKEKAHRLHQFVCTRLGLKPSQDKDRRGGSDAGPPVTGFTPRPTVTLDQKLATLQDYLDTTAQTTMGAKGNASMLGKYRQMKRFGSILKSRMSTSTNLAATATLLVNTSAAGSPNVGSS